MWPVLGCNAADDPSVLLYERFDGFAKTWPQLAVDVGVVPMGHVDGMEKAVVLLDPPFHAPSKRYSPG